MCLWTKELNTTRCLAKCINLKSYQVSGSFCQFAGNRKNRKMCWVGPEIHNQQSLHFRKLYWANGPKFFYRYVIKEIRQWRRNLQTQIDDNMHQVFKNCARLTYDNWEAHFVIKLHTQKKKTWKKIVLERQDIGYFWWNKEGQDKDGANGGSPEMMAKTWVVVTRVFALEFIKWQNYFFF